MELRVRGDSDPKRVARAIAATIYREGEADVRAMGPDAVSCAVKAIAIARGIMAPNGYDLVMVPAFSDAMVNGVHKTVMRLLVKPRGRISIWR